MADSPTTIYPFPELRQLAESEARDCHNRFSMLTWGVSDGWDELDDEAQATLIRVHVDRLCDLTRPASRDAVVGLVAERVGWPAWEVAMAENSWSTIVKLCTVVDMPAPDRWDYHPPFSTTLATIVRHLWPQE